ncbi:AraC family transcriptional regulator with amidase-like domain [Paraburkholderia sp. GV068]|jgi:transcriptional regulator GlxA family with amidase domain|uniref:Transcriptional regulator GlxA family with amidase domain n=1 Tax=Paraburkholderia graminis TaxID=60548 RepID=A0ABD5CG83_9BURK|nr:MULTISPECIES: GlxA family transcriptional regulator [Paraburkholderia]AXF11025.1 AraC family transcriptional regulator [Paraburkholderia graminis]MDR6204111.1 transcriptional regulator GlxA family with amidase domain [Paraburkholderia graminis]MDR6471669.1 transcriptional regulator GlxA family with amidase domain [Paraburkholderia graminis]PTQ98877.1 AraC family transcriptional regulator with amidase-like domain [Paraburkholderia sp. GV072]PUB04369.1 AraC family transcriptional regulator wi
MHTIGFVVFPNFYLMGFAAVTAFELANGVLEEPAYDITLLSEKGGLVPSSAGIRVETQPFGDATFDTVMFGSGVDIDLRSPALTAFVRRSLETSRRIAAPCTGAFVLAEAGALDGRRATTHWRFANDLQRRFPKIAVEEDQIFIVDGPIWTSAGMTATIDMALAMIEKDHGQDVSRTVARKLVVYHRRAGGQSQFSTLLDLDPKSDKIQKAIDHANANLRNALTVEELAEVAGLSPRQFSRAFSAETGQSPAKAVEHLRVEAARLMLEKGRLSLDVIADEVGFTDRERMRRAFLRTIGQPPQAVRRLSREARGVVELHAG